MKDSFHLDKCACLFAISGGRVALAIAAGAFLVMPVAAFENLDFEGTLLDLNALPDAERAYDNPDIFDPEIVTPGWSYRAEYLDYSVITPFCDGGEYCIEYPVHGAMIYGHLGTTSQVVMSVNSLGGLEMGSLQGRHSLWLYGDTSDGPLEDPIPVAYQNGVVPVGTKSILIKVRREGRMRHPSIADSFSVRFNGYEVEMHSVNVVPSETGPLPDYPDDWLIYNTSLIFSGTRYLIPR